MPRRLKSHVVQMRGTTLGKKQNDEAERLYGGGLSLAKVAEQIGVNATTVRKRLRVRGLALRPPHAHLSSSQASMSDTAIQPEDLAPVQIASCI
jgi:hypothetical protein